MGKQQIFPSGAGTVEVDCGEDAAFGKFAVEMDFHIARTLEFFVNDVVHARAGINERGGDYGERTAVFYISRTAEEPLGGVERAGVDTAGKRSARGRNGKVIGACKTGERIHYYNYVLAQLHVALGALYQKFRRLAVVFGHFVKRGINDFAANGTLHIRNFFGTFVHKEHEKHYVGIIIGDCTRYFFEERGFTRFGRGHYHSPLPLTDRRYQVDTADCEIVARALAFELEAFVGINGYEIVELRTLAQIFGSVAVDRFHGYDGGRTVFRVLFGYTHNHVACAQSHAANEFCRHVSVLIAVFAVFRTQKAVTFRKHVEHAALALAVIVFQKFFGAGVMLFLLYIAVLTVLLLAFRRRFTLCERFRLFFLLLYGFNLRLFFRRLYPLFGRTAAVGSAVGHFLARRYIHIFPDKFRLFLGSGRCHSYLSCSIAQLKNRHRGKLFFGIIALCGFTHK